MQPNQNSWERRETKAREIRMPGQKRRAGVEQEEMDEGVNREDEKDRQVREKCNNNVTQTFFDLWQNNALL